MAKTAGYHERLSMTDHLDPTDNRTRSVPGQLTLTAGPEQGDLQGSDDKILQAGVDYLHRLGGGTLHILPGEYAMRNALFLRSSVTIRGSGEDTVLKKAPGICTPLARDSDWYEARLTVADPAGFTPGCGIMLRGDWNGRMEVVKDTVVEIQDHELALSRRLEKDFWVEGQATAATVFPLLTAEWVDDVCVENLVLDGNKAENEEINGNYAGAVFIQHCDRYLFRNVTARNYNGDGYSFQVCDDIRFENCRSIDNANLGFHPGSGSQRPVFKDCVARGNSQGIFFCWGVTHGLAENCICSQNRDYGISIGHRDTDNRIASCTIERNEKIGVLFRHESSKSISREFRAPHRNTIELCAIRDNGFKAEGVGVDIPGPVHDLTIRDNRIEDSGEGLQKIGVRVGEDARNIGLAGNTFAGLEVDIDQP